MKKAELKTKKQPRVLKLLETCKCHQGPVTPNSVVRLQHLIEKEILSEISYLIATIAPDILQMRRVKVHVNGKFKRVRFSVEELRQSIRNAVKPESDLGADIDVLLSNVL